MAALKSGLKAATLLESLVAMIIVMICFGIACMIYVNVMNSDRNRQKLSAQLVLNELAFKIKKENNYLDEKIESESLIVQKTAEKYKDAEGLTLLTLIAFDKQERKIAEYRELVIVP